MAGINIVRPGTIPGGGNTCIPVDSFILGNLNEVCAADKIVLPKKDRIGTGKTLYTYVKKDAGIDQSDRAVSYNQGNSDNVFYTNGYKFYQNFNDNIPNPYSGKETNRLIPEKYLYAKEDPNIKESVISARNLPCALTKVVHSNTKTSDPYNSCNDNTIVQSSFSSHLQDNRDVLSLAISGNCSVYTIALLILHGAATNCVDDVHFNSSLLLSRNVVVYYIKLS